MKPVRLSWGDESPGLFPAAMLDCFRRAPSPALAADWWVIACGLQMADRTVQRGAGWFRRIALRLAVSDPVYWESRKGSLRRIVRFLGGDELDLEFVPSRRPPLERDHASSPEVAASPSLFSGGLDALFGASILPDGAKAVLVRVGSRAAGPARSLAEALIARGIADRLVVLPTALPGHARETSGRLRSILYLVGAALVAAGSGDPRIGLHEHGVLACHCPWSPARVSSYTTHGAHPWFLREMEALLGGSLLPGVRIVNRAWTLTRTGTLIALRDRGLAELVPMSFSCQRPGVAAPRHCGICLPCIQRRMACCLALGNEGGVYKANPLLDWPDVSPEAKDNVLDLARFARLWVELPDQALPEAFPWIWSSGLLTDEQEQIIGTYRCFGAEVRRYLEEWHPRILSALWPAEGGS